MKLSTLFLAGAGAAVTAVLVSSRGKDEENTDNGGGEDDGGGDVVGMTRKQRMWFKLQLLPLTQTQRYLLMLWAYGEGRYSAGAHNTSASERAAASKAVDNNPEKVARVLNCGVPVAVLRDGSWGTFQRLGPYFSIDMFEVFGEGALACQFADPRARDIDLQILSAMETARDLQGYASYKAKPTVGNLRLGTGVPTRMGYLVKNKASLDKYRAQAEHEHLPAGIIDATLTDFPKPTYAMLQTLRASPV